jgi:hypothetical protein
VQGETIRLPARAKAWRAVLLGVLAALFLAGTAVGNDDWWPFGPWRMFATSTAPTGGIAVLAIEVLPAGSETWQPAPLTLQTVGLNRAEVEGRVPQLLADPALLGTLATTHARLRPDDPPWVGVRVVREETVIRAGRPTGGHRSTVLAQWRAS